MNPLHPMLRGGALLQGQEKRKRTKLLQCIVVERRRDLHTLKKLQGQGNEERELEVM